MTTVVSTCWGSARKLDAGVADGKLEQCVNQTVEAVNNCRQSPELVAERPSSRLTSIDRLAISRSLDKWHKPCTPNLGQMSTKPETQNAACIGASGFTKSHRWRSDRVAVLYMAKVFSASSPCSTGFDGRAREIWLKTALHIAVHGDVAPFSSPYSGGMSTLNSSITRPSLGVVVSGFVCSSKPSVPADKSDLEARLPDSFVLWQGSDVRV